MATAYGASSELLEESKSTTALVPFSTDVELPRDVSECLEPLCRFYHLMHAVGAKAYLYGGCFNKAIPHSLSLEVLSSTVHIFDPKEKKWISKSVYADALPLGIFDAASTVLEGNLCTYGGTDASGFISNDLYQLDINSMEWNRLVPVNPDEGPIPKAGCGMVAFSQNLGVFGGYGISNKQQQSGNGDTKFTSGRTNEFHCFDLESASWFSIPPSQGSSLPPPCSHFTLTQVDSQRAILFGGYSHLHGCLDAVYILDFHTMSWSMTTQTEGTSWPPKRCSHAACLCHNGLYPHLLVTGGQGNQRSVLSDAWMFDINAKSWKELPVTVEARWGHSVTAIPVSPSRIAVLTFGGSLESWSGNQDDQLLTIARTRIFVFEFNDVNEWVCISEAYLPEFTEDILHTCTIECEIPTQQRQSDTPRHGDLQMQIHLSETKAIEHRERAEAAEKQLHEEQEQMHELEIVSEQRIQEIEGQISQLHQKLQETSEMVKCNLHKAELRVLDERHKALDHEERVYRLEMDRDMMLTNLEQSKSSVALMQTKVDELTKCLNDKDFQSSDVKYQEHLMETIRKDAREKIAAADRRTAAAKQRIKEAQLRMDAANQRIVNAEHRLNLTENQTVEALKEANDRVRSLESETEGIRRTMVELGERTRDTNESAERGNLLIQEKQVRVGELEAEIGQIEEQRRRTDQRIRDHISRAEQAEQTIDELQGSLNAIELADEERRALHDQTVVQEQRGPSWEVNPQNLQISDDILGVGGWGEVRVATLTVAAKQLHADLAYDFHHQQFRREMCMAARVSHPNLLRFMGARVEGRMTIVTECMPTSLRAVTERGHANGERHLPYELILSISIDVTCALNYLHLMIPDPIIHRDLSSANVLLQPTPDGGFLAKVADYGSVNFQRLIRTEHPGCVIYEAPESHVPSLQSPKMDIYSFGVLLVEMCTCELPIPERRAVLIQSILLHRELVTMISDCMKENKDLRPTAAQLVDRLKSMQ